MKKRGRGSVTSAGKGRWLVQATFPEGRRTRRVNGSLRDAEDALREMLDEADAEARRAGCPTFAEFWESSFVPRCRSKGLAPTTVEGYGRVYRCHLRPVLGASRMCDIGPSQVSALLGSMTYGAARHAKGVLSSVFSLAEELEVVESSVMRRKYTLPAKTPENTGRRADPSVLTWGQMEAIAHACAGEMWEPAFLMMAFGGMRRSEACGVMPGDVSEHVDASGGVWAVVSLRRTVTVVGGQPHVSERMKTEGSRRDVVVAPPWAARLLALRDAAAAAGHDWMLQEGDGVANPATVANRYDDWFRSRPYRRVPMKNLRNSYATAMVAAGVDSAMVSKMTGHSSLDVTYRHYLRPGLAEVMAALGAGPVESVGNPVEK